MVDRTLQAYIQRRGKQRAELLVGVTFAGKMPSEIVHDGQTFYFCGADLSRRTIIFTDVKASPAK